MDKTTLKGDKVLPLFSFNIILDILFYAIKAFNTHLNCDDLLLVVAAVHTDK